MAMPFILTGIKNEFSNKCWNCYTSSPNWSGWIWGSDFIWYRIKRSKDNSSRSNSSCDISSALPASNDLLERFLIPKGIRIEEGL